MNTNTWTRAFGDEHVLLGYALVGEIDVEQKCTDKRTHQLLNVRENQGLWGVVVSFPTATLVCRLWMHAASWVWMRIALWKTSQNSELIQEGGLPSVSDCY